jgi:hypothetical protein
MIVSFWDVREALKTCRGCHKLLPPRVPRQDRGHREREYCKPACRQRAYRERRKQRQAIDQHPQSVALMGQMLDMQHELLDMVASQRDQARGELDYQETMERALRLEIALLYDHLAEKEAEIVRLNILLEHGAKRKRP